MPLVVYRLGDDCQENCETLNIGYHALRIAFKHLIKYKVKLRRTHMQAFLRLMLINFSQCTTFKWL